MKLSLPTILLLISTKIWCQNYSENNVSIRMELESVVEINQLSEQFLKIANTEFIIINYSDKYFELSPGVRMININSFNNLTIESSNFINLKSLSNEYKLISNGINIIDYNTNQVLKSEDYIEYTINKKMMK